ncbi:hypothetical protein WKK05_00940 [Nostoc sp. UHCC 0302]|uniref:hypothetical protein n=1 Tax=Nostoc sp. UHCC 0302 TaxID=3134896 RepID=UPI00311CAED3
MVFGNKLNSKNLFKFSLATIGTLLLLNPSVQATEINQNSVKAETQTTSLSVSSSRSVVVAQNSICPENSGGSQFVTAETKNFLVYICGGDLPNTYVGYAKNGTTGGVILPLRNYSNNRFVAVNGNVRYVLTRKELTVTKNGRVIVCEKAIWR